MKTNEPYPLTKEQLAKCERWFYHGTNNTEKMEYFWEQIMEIRKALAVIQTEEKI